jgi:hypothetical protein
MKRGAAAGLSPQPDQGAFVCYFAAYVTMGQSGVCMGSNKYRRAAKLAKTAEPGETERLQKLSSIHVYLDADFIPEPFAKPPGDQRK